MGLVFFYLPGWLILVGFHVGKHTIPMKNPMGYNGPYYWVDFFNGFHVGTYTILGWYGTKSPFLTASTTLIPTLDLFSFCG